MNENTMPPEAQMWLRAVEKKLDSIERADRLEIVDGLRAHILDALDRGDNITTILNRLGTPAAVADQAMSEIEPARSEEPAKHLNARRVLQLIAFALTIVATLIIGFLPSYTAVSIGGDGEITSTTTNGFQNLVNLSPYFVSGMVLALLITLAPLVIRGRSWTAASITAAGLMVLLTVASIVLIGNWLLVLPTIASIVAALLPQRSGQPRVKLVSARA